MKVKGILLAAGQGKRFGGKKQFIKLNGKFLFEYSLETMEKIDELDEIIIVLPEEDMSIPINSSKKIRKVPGGKERQFSVYNALKNIENADIVVIHDSARIFVSVKMFQNSIKNVASGYDGSVTAIKARDTIKEIDDKKILKTLDRNRLIIVQTPQAFDFKKLLKAHEFALEKGVIGTDDASLMELLDYNITYNEGSFLNFKITEKDDLILAKCLLKGGN